MGARFSFVVEGRPRTWQRTAHVRGRRLTPKGQREAKRQIGWLARAALPRGWPTDATYAVTVVGYWPDRRFGDADRLLSLPMDALEGIAYRIDRQVRRVVAEVLVDRDHPRTEVTVEVIDE